MKFYIAGITINNSTYNSAKKNCATLKSMLHDIDKDAKKAQGKNVITILVLQEYAFTEKAIDNQEKKECLALLHKAIRSYENVILIPGSFASYEVLSSASDKEKTIGNNY